MKLQTSLIETGNFGRIECQPITLATRQMRQQWFSVYWQLKE